MVLAADGADTVCDDVDQQACQKLATSMPDLCSDPCLAKFCKRLCGQCRMYFQRQHSMLNQFIRK
ncbi:hypothetical protein FSP39_015139 [Pinctada imbricata]|uniref:ShKT domain-containing protein n=1 Tax=Pinctada imbricata TaxID=66713 RepID=A0AA89C7H3_PINIB|nr:hypothetical protein FSP39_015139 [Pinctada imbricata]